MRVIINSVKYMRALRLAIFAGVCGWSGAAAAAPGLDSKVYGTQIEPGITELESRYARLTGKQGDGTSALVLEASHGFSNRFYGALLTTLDHAPDSPTEVVGIALEGIYRVGTIPGIGVDVALYGEYAVAFRNEPHNLEFKALLEKSVGGLDTRLNLVAERLIRSSAPVVFSYAASADYPIIGDEIRLGVQAFGDLGDTHRFAGRQEHFIGPVAKFEIEHMPFGGELGIETGYLFAAGAARDNARGQARLLLEWEFHF